MADAEPLGPGEGPSQDKSFWSYEDWTLGQKEYDWNNHVFPSDLADDSGNSIKNSYQGHYMVININVSNKSNYENIKYNGTPINLFNTIPNEVSKTDALRFTIDNDYTIGEGNNKQGLGRPITDRPRWTRRIKESIAIAMPNAQLDFSDVHDYQSVSLLELGTNFASGVTGFVADIGGAFFGKGLAGKAAEAVTSTLAGRLGDALPSAIGNLKKAINSGTMIAGTPINPKTEVLFTNTAQREFTFEFLFSPTNPNESRVIKQIIKTLRIHAAPELRGQGVQGSVSSFFFVPPSEFDITFYRRGEENRNINRINTCVLDRMDVSYAPIGIFSTFSNGYPVSIRMMLHFREVEITHRLRVIQGF